MDSQNALDMAWNKEFVDVWSQYSVDTSVDIIFEPIPDNIEMVFNLNATAKRLLKKALDVKDNSLTLTVDEEAADIYAYFNEDHKNIIFKMKNSRRKNYEPFRRETADVLSKYAEEFINIINQLITATNLSKIRLEAIPSDRSADEFGKSILRDVYGKYLVQKGVSHKQITINEYYYDDEDGELYKKYIPFRPPAAPKKKK